MLVKYRRKKFPLRTFFSGRNTMEHERSTVQIKIGGKYYVLQQ